MKANTDKENCQLQHKNRQYIVKQSNKQSKKMFNNSKIHPINSPHQIPLKSDHECRICLEGVENPQNPLLTPCDCKGSVQYIHENCAKQWVISTLQKMDQIGKKVLIKQGYLQCELCKYKIEFESIISLQCKQKEEITEGIKQFLFPFLCLVISIMIGLATLGFCIHQFIVVSKRKQIQYRLQQGLFFSIIIVMAVFLVIIIISAVKIFFLKQQKRVISIKNKIKDNVASIFKTDEADRNNFQELQEIDMKVILGPRKKKNRIQDRFQNSQETMHNIRMETTINSSIILYNSITDGNTEQ